MIVVDSTINMYLRIIPTYQPSDNPRNSFFRGMAVFPRNEFKVSCHQTGSLKFCLLTGIYSFKSPAFFSRAFSQSQRFFSGRIFYSHLESFYKGVVASRNMYFEAP